MSELASSCMKCNQDKRKCDRAFPSCSNCLAPRFVKRNPNYQCCYPVKAPGVIATHKNQRSSHTVPSMKKQNDSPRTLNSGIPARTGSCPTDLTSYHPYDKNRLATRPISVLRSNHSSNRSRPYPIVDSYSITPEQQKRQKLSLGLNSLKRKSLPHPTSAYESYSARWFDRVYSLESILKDRMSLASDEETFEEDVILARPQKQFWSVVL